MIEQEPPMTSGQIALSRMDKHEAVCEVRYTEIRDNIKEGNAASALAVAQSAQASASSAQELREAIRGTNRILVTATLSLIGVLLSIVGVLVFYMLTHPH